MRGGKKRKFRKTGRIGGVRGNDPYQGGEELGPKRGKDPAISSGSKKKNEVVGGTRWEHFSIVYNEVLR